MLRTAFSGPGPATARQVASTTLGTRLSSGMQSTARSLLLLRMHKRSIAPHVRQQHDFRPIRRRPSRVRSGNLVVLGLVAANVAVTVGWLRAQLSRPPRHPMRRFQVSMRTMLTHFTTSTQHLDEGRYYTLVTAMFSQASVGHLGANMLGLYFFGRQLGDVLGPRRFLRLYLASGVLSSAAAVLEQKMSGKVTYNLGASGAVNGITAMSILLFPHGTLLVFGIVPLPAWVAGSFFLFKDAYSFLTDQQDGIGHVAHLSGAVVGGVYYVMLRRRSFRRF